MLCNIDNWFNGITIERSQHNRVQLGRFRFLHPVKWEYRALNWRGKSYQRIVKFYEIRKHLENLLQLPSLRRRHGDIRRLCLYPTGSARDTKQKLLHQINDYSNNYYGFNRR